MHETGNLLKDEREHSAELKQRLLRLKERASDQTSELVSSATALRALKVELERAMPVLPASQLTVPKQEHLEGGHARIFSGSLNVGGSVSDVVLKGPLSKAAAGEWAELVARLLLHGKPHDNVVIFRGICVEAARLPELRASTDPGTPVLVLERAKAGSIVDCFKRCRAQP